ncbi:ATP-binding protein [Mordavella massiliensis]|uniref:ATP-binding protein n=1 Tax=Mordavella massiliensis TaxID=1871024 RepID=A0A939BF92_9CLOT|nr:ATP-binding protein [Mordavella massiliensis]
MALTNSQYDQIMRVYEQRRLDNEHRRRRRYEEIYEEIPQIRELENEISSLSLREARRLLGGDPSALGSLRGEIRALSEKKLALLAEHGYPADYLELHYTCSDCRDTGYIDGRKCHCFRRAVIDLLYTQSGLQEILERENFDTFSLDYYSPGHIDRLTGRSSREAIEIALKSCREFTDTFGSEFRNLLLYGDTGVGKTFLSHCIARELLDKSFSVIYLTAARLFDIFAQNTFHRDEEPGFDQDHIYGCDLLIIDDLGTEMSNSFTNSQLFICLNERILRRKATLISTNLSLEDLKNVYSERVFSRITSAYTVLRITGDDIRIQKKLMNRI